MELPRTSAASRQENLLKGIERLGTDGNTDINIRLPRKTSLRTNFSYPRLSRHGSRESQSSNGSIPGMTDASDSDISFDDDSSYNASAGELWDSFWPTSTAPPGCRQAQEQQINTPSSEQREDCFKIAPTRIRRLSDDENGNSTGISIREQNRKATELASLGHIYQSAPIQAPRKASITTYSVYPKAPVTIVQRNPHPPRTSSLGFESPSPLQQPLYRRGNGPNASLKHSKSTYNMNPLFIPPRPTYSSIASQQLPSSTAARTAASAPTSPAYPTPPPPQALRPSSSAFSLQEKAWAQDNNKGPAPQSITTSLPPLLPSALPNLSLTHPGAERMVSVFEPDSDSESEDEGAGDGRSFARRIARGLHKKSASEKRYTADRKTATSGLRGWKSDSPPKATKDMSRNSRGLDRKRGGSLGRIFWLMGR
ncbi:hypothetical protein SAMD00023353_10800010 [Rosellinia necatrix]|uniref:Uncharacterized protein n=1 Tax=Rosellinia necatrix TaxID=77044 RepID=A0A1S8AB32_ROSNE|nr:hypothetical protein SAMD00023353_10800010 [Rosellinia necatrix]